MFIVIILMHFLTIVQASGGNSNCSSFPVLPIAALDASVYLPDKDGRTDYTRFTDARGVKILGLDDISDYVLADAARVIAGIMDRLKPQLSDALRAKKQRIYIVPQTHGLGLTSHNWCWIPTLDGPDTCSPEDHGPWGYLVHEFGHAVNGVFKNLDGKLQSRLDASYQNAKTKKIWPADTYGMTSVAEYFPLCWTPSWYKINHACSRNDPDPSFCSRDLCADRDPTLYGIVSDLRTGDELNLECATRCNPTTVARLPVECKTGVRVSTNFDRRLSSGSPASCFRECQKDAQCRAATYDAKNRYGSDCFLYNGKTQTTNQYDWTTCFKHLRTGDELNLECATRCSPTTVAPLPVECKTGVRVTSNFDRRLSSGSPASCLRECQKDAQCRAATYDAKNRYGSDCFLYNGQTKTVNESDWTTCFKH